MMAGTPGRSGGPREGKPGRKYPNRSDMRQAPKAATGQTYGAAKQQLDAQKQIPLLNSSAAPAGPSPAAAAPAGGGGPQVIPSLTAPTTRPSEPITAGLSTGPGAGPEALSQANDPLVKAAAILNSFGGPHPDPILETLRRRVQAHLANQGAA